MAPRSKRDEILETAGELFIRHGFQKVSMDQIAEAVPVSKPTLYSNFDDKKTLFFEVISARCQSKLSFVRSSMVEGRTPQQVLQEIGERFVAMTTSKDSLRMHRILSYECEEFPEAMRQFYESGPKQMHASLRDYLAEQHKKKTLIVKDPSLSADMYLSMIKGYPHMLALFGIKSAPSAKEIEARVRYAVDLFLKAHS